MISFELGIAFSTPKTVGSIKLLNMLRHKNIDFINHTKGIIFNFFFLNCILTVVVQLSPALQRSKLFYPLHHWELKQDPTSKETCIWNQHPIISKRWHLKSKKLMQRYYNKPLGTKLRPTEDHFLQIYGFTQ